MNLTGILIGAATFLTIGVFHPLVIKAGSLWSILELVKQRQRVNKGWFPEGPGHKKQNR